jgi:hypothetical protein
VRVGFTGTRWGMTELQKQTVARVLATFAHKEFHHGDCIGADAQAHDLARTAGYWIVGHPPTKSDKRAGCLCDELRPEKDYLTRNIDIVRESQVMVATPWGFEEEQRSGTWMTVRSARKMGRSLIIVWPNGTTKGGIK